MLFSFLLPFPTLWNIFDIIVNTIDSQHPVFTWSDCFFLRIDYGIVSR